MSKHPGARFASVLVALALPAGAPAQEMDEHAGHAMAADSMGMPTADRIEITNDPEAKRFTVALGPIDLPAGISHHALEQIPVQEGEFPFDFTIRGYASEAVDMHGNPVPRTVIHHLNLLDPHRRELFLPIMLRVLAASHETPPMSLPGWLFGIPMQGGRPFLALTMLHNPTDVSYEGVTIRLIIEYERRERLPVYPVVPFHLDTMFPEEHAPEDARRTKAFDLPPGHTSVSYDASPAIAGLILGIGGHLHAYATRLKLEDVTTGDVLYDVIPELSESGHVERIPTLLHRGKGIGALIEPSHVYRVTAEYWNPTDEVIPNGGMGAIAGAFLPLDGWPAADPGNALYAADYEWVFASQEGGHGEHGGHEHEGAEAASRTPRP